MTIIVKNVGVSWSRAPSCSAWSINAINVKMGIGHGIPKDGNHVRAQAFKSKVLINAGCDVCGLVLGQAQCREDRLQPSNVAIARNKVSRMTL